MPESPFRSYNPFLMPSRATRGNQVALPQYSVSGTTFTTTNTVDYLYAFSGTIVTRGRVRTGLDIDANISLIHSAPPASVEALVFLDFGVSTGTGYYVIDLPSLYIASATLYTNIHLANNIDLDAFNMTPGQHTIGVVVKLNTAGTLTMLDSSSTYKGLVNVLNTSERGFTQP